MADHCYYENSIRVINQVFENDFIAFKVLIYKCPWMKCSIVTQVYIYTTTSRCAFVISLLIIDTFFKDMLTFNGCDENYLMHSCSRMPVINILLQLYDVLFTHACLYPVYKPYWIKHNVHYPKQQPCIIISLLINIYECRTTICKRTYRKPTT